MKRTFSGSLFILICCLTLGMGSMGDQVSVKATTEEKLGFTGREEGISAYAVVLINS